MAGIVELTAFAGAVFAASFFPAIFGGLYLKWGTDIAALASMIVGILINIIWRFAFKRIWQHWQKLKLMKFLTQIGTCNQNRG